MFDITKKLPIIPLHFYNHDITIILVYFIVII